MLLAPKSISYPSLDEEFQIHEDIPRMRSTIPNNDMARKRVKRMRCAALSTLLDLMLKSATRWSAPSNTASRFSYITTVRLKFYGLKKMTHQNNHQFQWSIFVQKPSCENIFWHEIGNNRLSILVVPREKLSFVLYVPQLLAKGRCVISSEISCKSCAGKHVSHIQYRIFDLIFLRLTLQ